jgi:hypothetical protein
MRRIQPSRDRKVPGQEVRQGPLENWRRRSFRGLDPMCVILPEKRTAYYSIVRVPLMPNCRRGRLTRGYGVDLAFLLQLLPKRKGRKLYLMAQNTASGRAHPGAGKSS